MYGKESIQVEGRVEEILQNSMFKVALANGHRVLAHKSSKIRLNFVRIFVGDKVVLEMSPFDLSKGLIVLKGNDYESSCVC